MVQRFFPAPTGANQASKRPSAGQHSRGQYGRADESVAQVYDFFASEYGWTPQTVDFQDFWHIHESLPKAYEKRRALELLEDVNHTILTRGPEGEQVHKDAHGKTIEGEGSVTFTGLLKYEKELRRRAGLPDADEPKPAEAKSKGLEALNLLSKAFGGNGV